MNHDLAAAVNGLAPPDSMMGTRGTIAWLLLVGSLGLALLSVRILPRAHPVRVFIEGTVSLVLGGVTATPPDGYPVALDS